MTLNAPQNNSKQKHKLYKRRDIKSKVSAEVRRNNKTSLNELRLSCNANLINWIWRNNLKF